MAQHEKLPISVIIPALNAAKTLALTLSSLNNNTIRPNEILVIDALSVDETVNIAKSFNCKIIKNHLQHTAAARQIGIMESQNEIIAMTDSDCVPDPDWLERIQEHFLQDSKLDGIGGCVRLKKPVSRVQAYCGTKAVRNIPQREEYIVHKGMRGRFPGSNCAYRRDALMKVGGFTQSFKTHGEDIDMFWRLVDKNSRLLFDPGLIVEHLGFSTNLISLARKSFGYGEASAWLARSHFPGQQFDLSLLWRPWIETVQEFLRQNEEKYPECIFIDDFMFSLGRMWGLINGNNTSK
jgi:glycosyltransferase involved in cell wall biosynthesis